MWVKKMSFFNLFLTLVVLLSANGESSSKGETFVVTSLLCPNLEWPFCFLLIYCCCCLWRSMILVVVLLSWNWIWSYLLHLQSLGGFHNWSVFVLGKSKRLLLLFLCLMLIMLLKEFLRWKGDESDGKKNGSGGGGLWVLKGWRWIHFFFLFFSCSIFTFFLFLLILIFHFFNLFNFEFFFIFFNLVITHMAAT